MTFVAGLVAGIIITALGGMFVFQARVIEGEGRARMPDLRSLIAVAALIIAIVALARSGQHDSHTTTEATVPATAPTTEVASGSSTTASTSSSTTSTTVLREVTVPKVTGLTQDAAIAALEGSGLKAHVETVALPGSVPPGFVVTQSPMPFSTTTSGAIVALGVSGPA